MQCNYKNWTVIISPLRNANDNVYLKLVNWLAIWLTEARSVSGNAFRTPNDGKLVTVERPSVSQIDRSKAFIAARTIVVGNVLTDISNR